MSDLSEFAGAIWLLFLTKSTVELSYDTCMVGVALSAGEGRIECVLHLRLHLSHDYAMLERLFSLKSLGH